jgi:KaiC/GvpD/RAD55 family RecA-like ATPase
MSFEEKLIEKLKANESKTKSEKAELIVDAIEQYALDKKEENRKNVFYEARKKAREENDLTIQNTIQAMKEEFNTKWQEYENNDFTIPKEKK